MEKAQADGAVESENSMTHCNLFSFFGVIHAFQLAPMCPSTADFRRGHAIRRAFGFDDSALADVQSDVVIPLRGVEFVDGSAGFERLAIGSFSGGQAAGCAAVTAEHGVAAVIAVPAELPKRPRKKAGAVRHAVPDPFLTIFLCLLTARGVLLCLRPDFARRAVDVPPAITQCRLELRNQLKG